MRFSFTALLALAATAIAQVAQDPNFDDIKPPSMGEQVPAGSTYEIKWLLRSKKTGTVTIQVLGGKDGGSLVPKDTIATGVENTLGKYTWKVDAGLGKDKTYGILITLDSDPTVGAYSEPFAITGYGGVSASASASGSSSASASSGSGSASASASSSANSSASNSSSASPSTTLSKSVSKPSSATSAPASSSASAVVTASSSSPSASAASGTSSAASSSSSAAAAGLGAGSGSVAAVGGIVAALLAL